MRRVPRRGGTWLLLAAAMAAGGCTTSAPPVPVYRAAAEQAAHNRQVLDQVWELVNAHYFDVTFGGADWPGARERHRAAVEAAPDDASLYDALNAMLDELHSSHTAALSPLSVWRRKTRLYLNTGVVSVGEPGCPRLVFEVLPDSPAMEAGIRKGWIETKEIQMLDPAEAPAVGANVFGEFLDERDRPRRIEMTLREIKIGPRRVVRELPGGVVYLRFDNFSAETSRWFEQEIKSHRRAGAAIVDLRFNLGGQREDLLYLLAGFFPQPVTVGAFVERKEGPRDWTTPRDWGGEFFAGRLVVLTSRRTASSAEIFAAAIRHYRRGIIVGNGPTTAGHVLASREWRLPDGGRLQIALEDFLTTTGERLEGRGVRSDLITPPMGVADLRAGIDTDIRTALAVLNQVASTAEN